MRWLLIVALSSGACTDRRPIGADDDPAPPSPGQTTHITTARGGVACSLGDVLCLVIPPRAFATNVGVTIVPAESPPMPRAIWGESAFDVTWAPPVAFSGTAGVYYRLAAVPDAPRAFVIGARDQDTWSPVTTLGRDTSSEALLIWGEAASLSTLAVVNEIAAACVCDTTEACDDGGGDCLCDIDCPPGGALEVYPLAPGGTYEAPCEERCATFLGTVSMYARANATFALVASGERGVAIGAHEAVTEGGLWRVLTGPPLPTTLTPGASALVIIDLWPAAPGETTLTVTIPTNSETRPAVVLEVNGSGVFTGAPDIEVSYDGFSGPASSRCVDEDDDGVADRCTMPYPLALDPTTIGTTQTAELRVSNVAACDEPLNADPCSACSLVIAEARFDDDEEGRFSIGPPTPPFDLPQGSIACEQPGEVLLPLSFTAPMAAGTYEALLVITSNAPGESTIEIPVRAVATTTPVAIVDVPEQPLAVAAPVTLDGSGSYDPRDPEDETLLTRFRWECEHAPAGIDAAELTGDGQGTPSFTFVPPVLGEYRVRLTVTNIDGLESLPTDASLAVITLAPPATGGRLAITLDWDNELDLDLHVTHTGESERVCNVPWDCFWENMTPIWIAEAPDANPVLDRDVTTGYGPETVTIASVADGTYRAFAHMFGGMGPGGGREVTATLHVSVDDVEAGAFTRVISGRLVLWAIADIEVTGGVVTVIPYPSDTPGEAGAVVTDFACAPPEGTPFP